MAENSKISWTDHTFNPWVGCTKVSPACDGCYAESWAKRTGQAHLWAGQRRRTTEANWREPLKWNRKTAMLGVRHRVFCASLADVFDNQVPEEWRADLWALIADTPSLDWLLLTKRPQNISKMLPGSHVEQLLGRDAPWGDGWPNVWLGTTVENQEEADRRVHPLLAVPAVVRFLSCEPLLGPVELKRKIRHPDGSFESSDYLRGNWQHSDGDHYRHGASERIHWVIVGGESGPHARPSQPTWFRSLRDQCAAAGVAFHFKQWGEFSPDPDFPGSSGCWMKRVGVKDAGRILDGVSHDAFPEPST